MLFFAPPLACHPADRADRQAILSLAQTAGQSHVHLDWKPVEDWLGAQPFLLAKRGRRAVGVLACPPDPPDTAWVRLFAAADGESPERVWNRLWPQARQRLQARGVKQAAGLRLDGWMEKLYLSAGFQRLLDVVVLSRPRRPPTPAALPGPARIQRAQVKDYPAIIAVDLAAFAPPWQLSPGVLHAALAQADYLTVVETDGEIAGYQLTTPSQEGAHLARLAVAPRWQGHGLGRALVADLTAFYDRRGARTITVNTQNTNAASLAVYRRAGFEPNGARFPMFLLALG